MSQLTGGIYDLMVEEALRGDGVVFAREIDLSNALTAPGNSIGEIELFPFMDEVILGDLEIEFAPGVIGDGSDTPGVDYDHISVVGTPTVLDIAGGSTINLLGIDDILDLDRGDFFDIVTFPSGIPVADPATSFTILDDGIATGRWRASLALYDGMNHIRLTFVPEPGTIGLMATGMAALFGWRRRRKKAA